MTSLHAESYDLPAADLGPENPLPVFRESNHDTVLRIASGMTEEDRRYLGWETAHRVLPYRIQDGYNRTKNVRRFTALTLENEILRAVFLPELGGRLTSLLHKPSRREILHRNPVFQPANLALRNAWFSGGVEWNASHLGHHYLTCSPVFAARVDSPEGYPILRIYEWDRVKCFPWKIEFHLPPDATFLFARVSLVNPHDYAIPMYWWTNMAVTETEGTRTLAPATTALHGTATTPLDVVSLPICIGADVSYSTQLRFAQEFYYRLPEEQRRWVAALDEQGRGLVQTSTRRLRGRKLFVWGMNEGGRHWQEYLSAPGQAYLEIQAGLARTQQESVPMPAGAVWTWTEAFGLLEADAAKVHSSDWNEALAAVESALQSRLSERELELRDEAFGRTGNRPPDEILFQGSGWGALERRRLKQSGQADRIPVELTFADSTLGVDQAPWLALIERGVFPSGDPQNDPGAWMVQPEWRQLLEESVATGRSAHWLSWLHVGNMRMENSNPAGAVEAWKCSLECQHSAWALRNLAVVEQRDDNRIAAVELLGRAWQAGPKILSLAIEYVAALMQLEQYAELDAFVRQLPASIRNHERIHIASATAAIGLGRMEEAEELFKREFVTIREGETATTDLWFEVQARRLAAEEKLPLDDALRARVRRDRIPPVHLDFRIVEDTSDVRIGDRSNDKRAENLEET